MKLKLAENAGDERQARKFRSSTDGPRAAEYLADLKARVEATHDQVTSGLARADIKDKEKREAI